MKIYINGEERDATPEEEAEILATQAAAQEEQPNPLDLPLDRLTFWLVASSVKVSKWSVRDRIAAMPEETDEEFRSKAEVIAWFEEAKVYRRNDPILIRYAAAEGITPEELDSLWIWAVEGAVA